LSINHFCTTVPSRNASMLPTFWFEADAAHGVTDFLGVQSTLANAHGRNSCAYDPPNFGFSARLPSSESLDLTAIYSPLVAALGRTHEPKILVGWGAGGESVLRHAFQDSDTVEGVVLLDVSPNGIEWLDQKRVKNLTMDETEAFAKSDLRGRVSLTQLILGIGLPW
jgi:pimeloyl-ACP methyl ester carboxylesterase